jgi:hypothetical protein
MVGLGGPTATMNRSPERNTFQLKSYIERCEADGEEPLEEYIMLYKNIDEQDLEREANAQWKINNLEYDLRSTKWICDKVKAREDYAQNLYAAMCNNEFQKLDVWQVLKDAKYSCSWRYAGGIIADMQEKGDYIDWYCSGIKGGWSDEEYQNATKEDQERYHWMDNHFVGESVVTDEIREDLKLLGWVVLDQDK